MLIPPGSITGIDATYRRRLQSMLAVVETVDAVIATLQQTGQLDNTYIVFTSDNGFHLGQHRLRNGKDTGFEEDIRVPLIVRGPGVPKGVVVKKMTVNIDFRTHLCRARGSDCAGVHRRSFARAIPQRRDSSGMAQGIPAIPPQRSHASAEL